MSGSDSNSETILIRSSAATNGITTMLVGAGLASVAMALISFLPERFFLLGILFIAGSIVAMVMGFYKAREPKVSLEISKQKIHYHHRKGNWTIHWDNIQRIDVPRVQKGLEHIDLELVGFKLRDPERFLAHISPRLITHLLMEQRPLLTQFIASNCNSGQCHGDDIIDDVKYKCSDGTIITGVTAMFANRMKKLQQGLGYDIYLSVNDIDRNGNEFVQLLRDCQESLLSDEREKQQSSIAE